MLKVSVKEDNWLSSFLDKQSFVVTDSDFFFRNHRLDDTIKSWKHYVSSHPSFTYCKVDTGSIDLITEAENLGFRLIDTNILLVNNNPIFNQNLDNEIQFATSEDKDSVMELAEKSFIYSRFHLDPKIDNSIANKIKANWAGNYFNKKRGDFMIVTKINSRIIGFLQVIKENEGYIIDLIAVDTSFRKMGVAKRMLDFANKMIPGINYVKVGTQIANVPSLRVYNSLGFKIKCSHYVFHLNT